MLLRPNGKVVVLFACSLLLTACVSTDVVLPAKKFPKSICNGSLSTRALPPKSTCYRPSLVVKMQTLLNNYGFDAGPEDGAFGRRTL